MADSDNPSGVIPSGVSGVVIKEKPLLVRIIAESKFVVDDGNDGQAEVNVPQPGYPVEFGLQASTYEVDT